MKQPFLYEVHHTGLDDNPAGGMTQAVGLDIRWQNGPLQVDGVRREPTGAFVETVIQAAVNRIEFYQASKFACADNAEALEHLNAALTALERRTKDREERQVEGTHQV